LSHARSNRKTSKGHPVVVGVADHTGWAILLSAAVVNGEPTVIDRRRVPLIEKGIPPQPYEHEIVGLTDTDAEQLLRQVKKSIAACTALAFDRLSADLWPHYRVSSLTIREPSLEQLPATVGEVRRSYHVMCRADGMLYHSAICAAARQRDMEVVFYQRGEELAKAADALKVSKSEVERFLNGLKKTLKPPWTAEHRSAFAAAIGALREPSRFHVRAEPGHEPDR